MTARAFKHAIERILDPAMEPSRQPRVRRHRRGEEDARREGDDARRSRRQGQNADAEADDATSPLSSRDDQSLCAVPPNLPVDREGAKAPLPSAAPYYVAEYVPGERLVLERNRFYKGSRCTTSTASSPTWPPIRPRSYDGIARGDIDAGEHRASDIAARAAEAGEALRR